MNTLQNLTVQNPVIQNSPATQPDHVIRLAEAMALLATLFQGPWNGATTYAQGQIVSGNGALLLSRQNNNLNNAPSNPPLTNAWWQVLLQAADGQSSYVYIAYASDANGTNFSLTPASSLGYVAFLQTDSPLAALTAANFTGLWVNFQGPQGNPGTPGTDGADGASCYAYVAYASDASGTNFSLTPAAGLRYVAFVVASSPLATPTAANFAGLWQLFSLGAPPAGVVMTDGNGNFSAADTDDLEEGANPANLWFTQARVLATVLTSLSGTVSGNVAATDTVLTAIGKLQNRLAAVENGSLGTAGSIGGVITVAANQANGQVTGLGLAFNPTTVTLTVSVPDGGMGLSAVVVGNPTPDGFKWAFANGMPNAAGYQIFWRIT
jgi:hypothetical protein